MIVTLILLGLVAAHIGFFIFAPAGRPNYFKPEYSTVDIAVICGIYAFTDAMGPLVRGSGTLLTLGAIVGTLALILGAVVLVTRYRYKWWYEPERRGALDDDDDLEDETI